jgi:hypothetical protein
MVVKDEAAPGKQLVEYRDDENQVWRIASMDYIDTLSTPNLGRQHELPKQCQRVL